MSKGTKVKHKNKLVRWNGSIKFCHADINHWLKVKAADELGISKQW